MTLSPDPLMRLMLYLKICPLCQLFLSVNPMTLLVLAVSGRPCFGHHSECILLCS
jgi:hypothetical protein